MSRFYSILLMFPVTGAVQMYQEQPACMAFPYREDPNDLDAFTTRNFVRKAGEGEVEWVKEYLKHGHNDVNTLIEKTEWMHEVNERGHMKGILTKSSDSALYSALKNSDYDMVKILIDAGANVNQYVKPVAWWDQFLPLDVALNGSWQEDDKLLKEREKIISLMLEHDARPSYIWREYVFPSCPESIYKGPIGEMISTQFPDVKLQKRN